MPANAPSPSHPATAAGYRADLAADAGAETLADARQPQLRAVQPADAPAMRRFVLGLSSTSRGLRFHGGVNPTSERLLAHLTQADGRRHVALVAVLPCDDGELIVGEARCVRGAAGEAAEFAICIADAWQGRGLARRLMRAVLAAAAEAGIDHVMGLVLAHNQRMAALMEREGFRPAASPDTGAPCWMRTLAPAPAMQSAAQPVHARLQPRATLRRLFGLLALR